MASSSSSPAKRRRVVGAVDAPARRATARAAVVDSFAREPYELWVLGDEPPLSGDGALDNFVGRRYLAASWVRPADKTFVENVITLATRREAGTVDEAFERLEDKRQLVDMTCVDELLDAADGDAMRMLVWVLCYGLATRAKWLGAARVQRTRAAVLGELVDAVRTNGAKCAPFVNECRMHRVGDELTRVSTLVDGLIAASAARSVARANAFMDENPDTRAAYAAKAASASSR